MTRSGAASGNGLAASTRAISADVRIITPTGFSAYCCNAASSVACTARAVAKLRITTLPLAI